MLLKVHLIHFMAYEAIRLAQIIEQFGDQFFNENNPTPYIKKTLGVLKICRTAALGGHVDQCSNDTCKHIAISYNSCRNRHCPQCQFAQKEQWITRMNYKILPVSYFHGVFTLPHELNGLCIRYPKLMYDLLFRTVWKTISGFTQNTQYGIKQAAMTAVLHTWGQQLSLHPHLHCIIPAGGMTASGKWKNLKGNNKKGKGFLFPIQQLQSVYKAKFLAGLRKLTKQGLIEKQTHQFLNQLYQKQWVVYAKRPFAGAKQVVEYLGRYTHKVAISNHRLIDLTTNKVTFKYKDYSDQGKTKNMTLDSSEFLRRFTLHILPPGFTKIRHFGLHSGACQTKMDSLFCQLNGSHRPPLTLNHSKPTDPVSSNNKVQNCPCCHANTMRTVALWKKGNAPPKIYNYL